MLRLLWHDYRHFPYERMLAHREVRDIFGVEPEAVDEGLLVNTKQSIGSDVGRLTYVKVVQNGTGYVVPDQAKLEASGNRNAPAWDSESQPVPSLRRQSTRYSAHGLHEYRGKFNPQVVRAIGNIFGLRDGAWVLDPFCGSGTTLLEAAHIGWNAVGVDINPLGVLIANAKITAFNASPSVLQRECDAITARIGSISKGTDWRDHLPEPDYLEKWFPVPVLRQLRVILAAIDRTNPAALRSVFRVILSDICREVSLQDPGDLRIRRRKDAAQNYPAIAMFLDSMQSKVASVVRARQHVQPRGDTIQCGIVADSRAANRSIRLLMEKRGQNTFEGAITSPPYATAMPYLDTQRLSLALLGLIESRELRSCEKTLIGNREIQDRQRIQLEEGLRGNVVNLPEATIAFCRHLLSKADHTSNGFRRRNVPALIYKYLTDMGEMFGSVAEMIKPKGRYALLVGRNTTELQGERIVIDTPALLGEVATSRGWVVEEALSFETYQRFDVHQSNSIREEVLLVLRRKSRK